MSPFLHKAALREHRRRNQRHTRLLLAGMALIVAAPAVLIFGLAGLAGAAAVVIASRLFAPRVPPQLVMRMYEARPIDARTGAELVAVTAELARRAELPRPPELYVVPSMTLNAFATGSPRHSALALTEGLIRQLSLKELIGVIAHEISHIRNNDLEVMQLADVFARITQGLAYTAVVLAVLNIISWSRSEPGVPWIGIVLLYLAPLFSSLLQLGLSRAREYDADLEAAWLCGDPTALIAALRRLESYTGSIWDDLSLPVPARRVPQPSLLRSHPSTTERIARLMEIDTRRGLAPIAVAEGPMISLVGLGPGRMRPRYHMFGVWY